MKWSIKLLEFDISFEPRKALKAWLFAEFIAEMTPCILELAHTWAVFTKGASNDKGSGAGLILENEAESVIDVSLRFEFFTTNNQEEYKGVIVGLTLASKIGARNLKLQTDSQLVVSKVKREAQP